MKRRFKWGSETPQIIGSNPWVCPRTGKTYQRDVYLQMVQMTKKLYPYNSKKRGWL